MKSPAPGYVPNKGGGKNANKCFIDQCCMSRNLLGPPGRPSPRSTQPNESPYGPASSGHQRPDVTWPGATTTPTPDPTQSGRQEVSQGRGFRWDDRSGARKVSGGKSFERSRQAVSRRRWLTTTQKPVDELKQVAGSQERSRAGIHSIPSIAPASTSYPSMSGADFDRAYVKDQLKEITSRSQGLSARSAETGMDPNVKSYAPRPAGAAATSEMAKNLNSPG